MKDEKTVEKSKTPELKAANEWALGYWDKRSLKTRTEQIEVPGTWPRQSASTNMRGN